MHAAVPRTDMLVLLPPHVLCSHCCSVAQVLHHPWVLRTLQIPLPRSLQQVVADYLPQARQLMAQGTPHVSTTAICNTNKSTTPLHACFA